MIATRTTDEEWDRYAEEIRERIALERWALQALALLRAPFPDEKSDKVRMVIKRFAAMREEAKELGLIE